MATTASDKARAAAQHAKELAPERAVNWLAQAGDGASRMVARTARVGLSPDGVVKKHQRRGHDVERLLDVRSLDLERVDLVRGRLLGLAYPFAAASSGALAAFFISGGEIAGVAGAGAAAAPAAGAIAGVVAIDAAAVLALSSRVVGHIGLLYGYDPEQIEERAFALSVINLGTAMTVASKQGALQDISRLTQALARDKAWKVLNESVLSRAYRAFLKPFETRATKASLGKFVPVAGIIIGAGLNWATLESIVDAADFAYRRRFLLEKYPHLDTGDPVVASSGEALDDDAFSVVDIIQEAADEKGDDE